jgi:hypothetical protein
MARSQQRLPLLQQRTKAAIRYFDRLEVFGIVLNVTADLAVSSLVPPVAAPEES